MIVKTGTWWCDTCKTKKGFAMVRVESESKCKLATCKHCGGVVNKSKFKDVTLFKGFKIGGRTCQQ